MTETYNQMLARVREEYAYAYDESNYIKESALTLQSDFDAQSSDLMRLIEHQARLIEYARSEFRRCIPIKDQSGALCQLTKPEDIANKALAELSGDKPVSNQA